MANTTSLAWPQMFDVARNRVAVKTDASSVTNRVKLLILTEPTEIYNEPNQGVGPRRHLWKYNTNNERAIFKDRIIEQLRLHEPCCIPDKTQFADGLLFTGNTDDTNMNEEFNTLKLTVAVTTTFGDTVNIDIDSQEVPE